MATRLTWKKQIKNGKNKTNRFTYINICFCICNSNNVNNMVRMIYNGVDMTDIISAFNRGEISRRKVENQIKLIKNTVKCTLED